jgi:hypothetical protein
VIETSLNQVRQPNVRVDRAARFHSTFAGPSLMRNTLPPLRSNELLGVGSKETSASRICF